MRKKVALIFGGRSLESDISVITAMQAYQNIDRGLYRVECVYMQDGNFFVKNMDTISDFSPFIAEDHSKAILQGGCFYVLKKNKLSKYFKPDVALVCCHGGEGENGVLQGLLEFNRIAYTSSNVLGSAIGMEKAYSKDMFDSMFLNTIEHQTVAKSEFAHSRDRVVFGLESFLTYPLIVKPACQGSSIGIAVANNRDELLLALDIAFEFDVKVIVEKKLVDFVEVNCAALRDKDKIVVSTTEQPVTVHDFLTFDDKYIFADDSDPDKNISNCQFSRDTTIKSSKIGNSIEKVGATDIEKVCTTDIENADITDQKSDKMPRLSDHQVPADIGDIEQMIRATTERIYDELNLNGVVRIDFLVDRTRDKVFVNEINTVPGSLAFYLFEPLGISYKTLLTKLIENALYFKEMNTLEMKFKTDVLTQYDKNSNKIGKKNRLI